MGRQRAGVLIPWKPQRGLFSRQMDKVASFAFHAGQVPLAAVLGGVEGTVTEQGKTAKTSSNSKHKIKTKGLGVRVLSKDHKMRGGCSSVRGRWEGGRENRIGVHKALGLIPVHKASTQRRSYWLTCGLKV